MKRFHLFIFLYGYKCIKIGAIDTYLYASGNIHIHTFEEKNSIDLPCGEQIILICYKALIWRQWSDISLSFNGTILRIQWDMINTRDWTWCWKTSETWKISSIIRRIFVYFPPNWSMRFTRISHSFDLDFTSSKATSCCVNLIKTFTHWVWCCIPVAYTLITAHCWAEHIRTGFGRHVNR